MKNADIKELNSLPTSNKFQEFVKKTLVKFARECDGDSLGDLLQDYSTAGNGIPGLTTYKETSDLYKKYAEDLHKMIIDDMRNMSGEFSSYIIKNFDDVILFKNAMVWECWEITISGFRNDLDL